MARTRRKKATQADRVLAYFKEVESDGATADEVAEATGFNPLSVGAIVSRLFNVERRIVASGQERLTQGDHYATVYVFDPNGTPVAGPVGVPKPSVADLAGFIRRVEAARVVGLQDGSGSARVLAWLKHLARHGKSQLVEASQ